ncbi:MAG: dynamin family protein [Lachnospiraceae bacterium]|nr:dynamin family protein [Lachnospiraceae bacterium]
MNLNEKVDNPGKETNPIERVRNIVKMSQEDFSDAMGVSRQTLINYGKNPSTIPNIIIQLLMLYSGLSYNELFRDVEMVRPVIFSYDSKLERFGEKDREAISRIIDNKELFIKTYLDVRESLKEKALDEIAMQRSIIGRAKEKVRVAVIGMAGAGKSTLINFLLEKEQSIYSGGSGGVPFPVFYQSKEDGMDSILDTVETVTRDGRSKRYTKKKDELLSDTLAKDVNLKIHNKDFKNTPAEVRVYSDAKILNDLVLIDTPPIQDYDIVGTDMTESFLNSDVIVLVSKAHKHMMMEEILILKALFESGADLNRILIVKSQDCLRSENMKYYKDSDPEKPDLKMHDDDYNEIKEAERIMKVLISSVKDSEDLPTEENLQKRFCYMDCIAPDLDNSRLHFATIFGDTVRQCVEEKEKIFFKREWDFCEDRIRYYSELVKLSVMPVGKNADDAMAVLDIKEITEEVKKARWQLKGKIDELKDGAVKALTENYGRLFNPQSIEDLLVREDARLKSSYFKSVVCHIDSQLRRSVEEQCKKDLEAVRAMFDDAVKRLENSLPQLKADMEYDAIRTKYAGWSDVKVDMPQHFPVSAIKNGITSAVEDLGSIGTEFAAKPLSAVSLVISPFFAAGLVAGVFVQPGRAGIWEKKNAQEIADTFIKGKYYEEAKQDVIFAYDQMDMYCDYLSDVIDFILKGDFGWAAEEDRSAVTAKVMLCQSMAEMYFSITSMVEKKVDENRS